MTTEAPFSREDEARAHEQEQLLQLLYLCPVGIVKLDPLGAIELLNPYAAQMLMPLAVEGRLTNFFDLFEAFAPELAEMARRFTEPAGAVCEDHRVTLPRGAADKVPVLSVTLQKVNARASIAVLTDVTAATERDRFIRESEQRLHAVLDGVKDYSICTVDADGVVTSWNRPAQRLDDYRSDEAIGRHMDFLIAANGSSESALTRSLACAARDGSHNFEGWRVRKDGQRYWASTAIGALRHKGGGAPIGFSMITQDLTERRRAEDRLRLLALTDSLTGTLNRRSFFADAKCEWARLAATGGILAVLLIDADFFKGVNDKYGHEGGDAALRRIAADCRAEIRAADILGRLGGEEFAILLPSATAESAGIVAQRIRARIEQTGQQAQAVACTVSIGVASSAASGEEFETLLKRADVALYTAKAGGRNRVVISHAA